MTQDEKKRAVAAAALEHVPADTIVGVGTGSTANCFVDALASMRTRVRATVASSKATAERLRGHGFEVLDLNSVDELAVYVDGADEANRQLHLVKGGGGALTREKIVAAVARRFVCIIDDSKQVTKLGAFPLPIEVVPMARGHVARQLVALGGQPVLREGFATDNGNEILDVHNLDISEPVALESTLDHITGVVCNGLFARRSADVLLVADNSGVALIAS